VAVVRRGLERDLAAFDRDNVAVDRHRQPRQRGATGEKFRTGASIG
jgi:hypothetical protein